MSVFVDLQKEGSSVAGYELTVAQMLAKVQCYLQMFSSRDFPGMKSSLDWIIFD